MTKLMTTLTIATIASILILGGLVSATPNAFSTGGGGYHDDDDDGNNCDYGNYGYSNHDYDHRGDCDGISDDTCDCEKPDTLKFKFSTPSDQTTSEFRIEIYKKLEDIDNPDKKLTSIVDVINTGDYQIKSSTFGKDKLNSKTVFAIYKIVENYNDELVASMEVHTSCSQPLYIGQTVMSNGYALEITDGLKDGKTSISESNPLTCGDEPEPEKIGSIVIKNALTNDNGGEAVFADFTYKLIDVDTGVEFTLIQDTSDPSLNQADVPKGTYTLSQTITTGISGTYTKVLITGDDNCPSMTDESFEIKKNKNISCTIYNDDNGNGSSGGGGIIFRNFSMQVKLGDNTMADSCDKIPDAADKNSCIEIINPSDDQFAIVDSALTSDTTIVLFSIIEAGQFETDLGAPSPSCTVSAIVQHDKDSFFLRDQSDGDSLPNNPSMNNSVVLKCIEMDPNKVYNVNYVMIDPVLSS